MRIIVLFDLPTGSKADRKSYAEFRKFLVNDGYAMEQFSVYTRVTLGRDNLESHIARLKQHLPSAGRVTVFALTEKQYESRMTLVCSSGYEPENLDLGAQMTLIV